MNGLDLTEDQRLAVEHKDGPLLVIAGPGAGKTRVITARVAALLAGGVHPAQIMVVTFTRAAAQEMRCRVEKMPGVRREFLASLRIGTFHSLFWNILNSYGQRLTMANAVTQRKWVEKALRQLGEVVNDEVVDTMLGGIGYAKNNMQIPSDVQREDKLLADVWRFYEQYKTSEGYADFDDLLVHTHRLLSENLQAQCEQQQRVQYLLVDEFQDTSKVQYDIIRLLAAPQNNLCVVGDVDQAIYAWRAARPEYLLSFTEHYPAAKTIMLRNNFRATPELISFANRVIINNRKRHPITIEPVRVSGRQPVSLQPETEMEEASKVLERVQQLRDKGTPLEEMAVFYRVNRYSRHLVNTLIKKQVPFTLWDKGKTFDQHWVTREVLAFLRLSVERDHLPSFAIVARRQLRLEEETIGNIVQDVKHGDTLWSAVNRYTVRMKVREFTAHLNKARDSSPAKALDYYLEELGFKSYLVWYADKRGGNLKETLSFCDDMRAEMVDYRKVRDYLQFVEQRNATLQQAKTETSRPGNINLMTLHAAKGLEFNYVWLVGATDGMMPHSRSDSADQYEEERRLFYVGCTRAKDQLYVLAPRTIDGKKANASPFLVEALGTDSSADNSANITLTKPKVGMKVTHKIFGAGKIASVKVDGDRHYVEVQFANDRRKLDWELCMAQEFLNPK